MKKISAFIMLTAGICLLMFCSKSEQADYETPDYNPSAFTTDSSSRNIILFKADFSVWDKTNYSDNSCGEPPVYLLTMEGEGNCSHLGGAMCTRMTFCCDTETGIYYQTVGTFLADNGDELYFEIPVGQIVANEEGNKTYYQTRFNDSIYFIGGTGHYAGALGWALTNAWVHDGTDEWRTDFFTEGILSLPKRPGLKDRLNTDEHLQ